MKVRYDLVKILRRLMGKIRQKPSERLSGVLKDLRILKTLVRHRMGNEPVQPPDAPFLILFIQGPGTGGNRPERFPLRVSPSKEDLLPQIIRHFADVLHQQIRSWEKPRVYPLQEIYPLSLIHI